MIRARYVALLIIAVIVAGALIQPGAIAKRDDHRASHDHDDEKSGDRSEDQVAEYLVSLISDREPEEKHEKEEKEEEEKVEEEEKEDEEDDDAGDDSRKPRITPAPAPSPTPTSTPALVPSVAPAASPAPSQASIPARAVPIAADAPPLSVSYRELNPPPLPGDIGCSRDSGNTTGNYSAAMADLMVPGAAPLDTVNHPRWKTNSTALPQAPKWFDLPGGAIILLILACAALVSYTAYSMIWKG